MSWKNIRGNKLRSFLTTLGIIIGVLAIITLITVMEGATDEITSQFSELGAGRVSVSVSGTALKRGLTANDLSTIGKIDNVMGVDPNLSFTRHVASGGTMIEDITIEGRSDRYFTATDDMISAGRPLLKTDMDPNARVCIIDEEVRMDLFPNESPIGHKIVISGISFEIVGVLSGETDNDVMSFMSLMSGPSNG